MANDTSSTKQEDVHDDPDRSPKGPAATAEPLWAEVGPEEEAAMLRVAGRAAVAANIDTRPVLVSFEELIDQGADRLEIGLFEQLDRALDMFAHSLDDRTH